MYLFFTCVYHKVILSVVNVVVISVFQCRLLDELKVLLPETCVSSGLCSARRTARRNARPTQRSKTQRNASQLAYAHTCTKHVQQFLQNKQNINKNPLPVHMSTQVITIDERLPARSTHA